LSRVIRLIGAERDHRVRTLRYGVAEQELELARLVAAGCEARAVVTLDPHAAVGADRAREAFERLERGRQGAEGGARHRGEIDAHATRSCATRSNKGRAAGAQCFTFIATRSSASSVAIVLRRSRAASGKAAIPSSDSQLTRIVNTMVCASRR